VGTDDPDVFLSSAGDDILDGIGGGDTYFYASGDGNDQIVDTGTNSVMIDTLELTDLLLTDVTLTRTLVDVLIADNVTQQVVTIAGQFSSPGHGIERLIFADGTEWDRQGIYANVTEYVGALSGTSGNDTLIGTTSTNVLIGREGNDMLQGKDGSDVYVFVRGDGQDTIDDNGWFDTDVLELHGYTPAEVMVSRTGTTSTAVLTFVGTTDQITLTNAFTDNADTIEEIHFDDGTVWTEPALRAQVLADAATTGNDTITGFISADQLEGGLGNDTLYGKDGSDTYVFTLGDGQDIIDDNGWFDTDVLELHGYAPSDVAFGGVGTTVEFFFAGTTDRVTLVNEINNNSDSIEQIVFDDGTVWTETNLEARRFDGTTGVDTLVGTADGDRLTGLAGDDTLTGGLGADTFVFRASNFGHDTITDFSAGAGFDDHLELDGFATFNDVVAALTDNGTDAMIAIDANNSITLTNVLAGDLHQDDFHFV
jgi:Ca2+-binding RTX toxin-like protein